MSTEFATIANMFKTNAQAFDKAIQGVPPEKWLFRPSDNSNHLTWIAGHVVVHRAFVAKMLGLQWSAPWEGLFARGAKLVGPEQYPDPAELQRSFREICEKVLLRFPASRKKPCASRSRRNSLHWMALWAVPSHCYACTRAFMSAR